MYHVVKLFQKSGLNLLQIAILLVAVAQNAILTKYIFQQALLNAK
jgi:hypothetical protein